MKKQITLYITRHGETEYNTEHRVQGQSDSPLTAYGRAVAARLGCGLSDTKFDYVYSSSAGRALDTTRIIMENMGAEMPINIDDNLCERGFGKLEGRIISGGVWEQAREAAIKAGHAGKFDMTILSSSYEEVTPLGEPVIEKPYNVEDFGEFKARLIKALDDICEKVSDGESQVLVVTHGFAIIAMLHALTGERYGTGSIDNASVTLIENVDGVYYVRKVNDTSYSK